MKIVRTAQKDRNPGTPTYGNKQASTRTRTAAIDGTNTTDNNQQGQSRNTGPSILRIAGMRTVSATCRTECSQVVPVYRRDDDNKCGTDNSSIGIHSHRQLSSAILLWPRRTRKSTLCSIVSPGSKPRRLSTAAIYAAAQKAQTNRGNQRAVPILLPDEKTRSCRNRECQPDLLKVVIGMCCRINWSCLAVLMWQSVRCCG